MGIHLLWWAHDNKCIRTHDAICNNVFASIAWEASFHVGYGQLHVLILVTPNCFCQHCHFKRWGLHFKWCCHSQFNKDRLKSIIMFKLKFCHLQNNTGKANELLWSTPNISILFLAIKVYVVFTNKWTFFHMNVPMLLGLLKGLNDLKFPTWLFSFTKEFPLPSKRCKHLPS
jgi:hypothetical protein